MTLTRRAMVGALMAAPIAKAYAQYAPADIRPPIADYTARLGRTLGRPIDIKAAQRMLADATGAAAARAYSIFSDVLKFGSLPEAPPIAACFERLFVHQDSYFPLSDTGRAEAVRAMNHAIARLRPDLGRAFGALAIPEVRVATLSDADIAAGKAGYRTPATATAPATYYVDLSHLNMRPSFTLPSAAYHETVPGHMLADAYPAHAPTSAWAEGWAIYAERLALALHAYAGSQLAELGALHWQLFRLGRAAADMRAGTLYASDIELIDLMRDFQGPNVAWTTPERDLGRLRRSPGQFAAEMLTALMIEAGRPTDSARWPDYHAQLLAAGHPL